MGKTVKMERERRKSDRVQRGEDIEMKYEEQGEEQRNYDDEKRRGKE